MSVQVEAKLVLAGAERASRKFSSTTAGDGAAQDEATRDRMARVWRRPEWPERCEDMMMERCVVVRFFCFYLVLLYFSLVFLCSCVVLVDDLTEWKRRWTWPVFILLIDIVCSSPRGLVAPPGVKETKKSCPFCKVRCLTTGTVMQGGQRKRAFFFVRDKE